MPLTNPPASSWLLLSANKAWTWLPMLVSSVASMDAAMNACGFTVVTVGLAMVGESSLTSVASASQLAVTPALEIPCQVSVLMTTTRASDLIGSTLPALDNRELLRRVRGVVRSDVAVVSERFVPVETGADEAIVRAALAAAGVGAPRAFGGVSDLYYVRDVPGIVWGPGRSEQSHAADEWIETAQLERAVLAYMDMVGRYFG